MRNAERCEPTLGTTQDRRAICRRTPETAAIQGAQPGFGTPVCCSLFASLPSVLFISPNAQSFTSRRVFQASWDRILQSVDGIAASHHMFAQRIDKDVEFPLRNFYAKKEMANVSTISANLQTMARELDEAQDRSEKLNKKGAKAKADKVDTATTRLEIATQQRESQAPFIFESLQARDEQRGNHLRVVLTQLETHEVDQATRTQTAAEDALNDVLEISTAQEIQNLAQRTAAGRPKLERRTMTRQSSVVAASSTLGPPPGTAHGPSDDDASSTSGRNEGGLAVAAGMIDCFALLCCRGCVLVFGGDRGTR